MTSDQRQRPCEDSKRGGPCPALKKTLNIRLLILPLTSDFPIGSKRSGYLQQAPLSVSSRFGNPPTQNFRNKFTYKKVRMAKYENNAKEMRNKSCSMDFC